MSAFNQRPAQNYYSAGMNPMDIPSDMDYWYGSTSTHDKCRR
jgi:hypothetical protein